MNILSFIRELDHIISISILFCECKKPQKKSQLLLFLMECFFLIFFILRFVWLIQGVLKYGTLKIDIQSPIDES